MDAPLRTKIMLAFVGVACLSGLVTVLTGTGLLNYMVVHEAQRRVELALTTARATLDRERLSSQRVTSVIANWSTYSGGGPVDGLSAGFLEKLRAENDFDLLQIIDARGRVALTARGAALGRDVSNSAIVRAALADGRACSGLRLVPIPDLAAESPDLADQAVLTIRETAHSKQFPEGQLKEAMIIETASPILEAPGRVIGVVRSAALLNRDYSLVDRVRENVFTTSTYQGRNLGTVTIFQHDVRIATNVTDERGERAVGTRVSAEVYDRVLRDGQLWIGPALVVDTWYISAYEPLRDFDNRIIGILYVGVIKQRYDDMRHSALLLFLAIVALALLLSVLMARFLAGRLTRPLAHLTHAAAAIGRGDLHFRLDAPLSAQRDEARQLGAAFHHMLHALRERDEQLRASYDRLQQTTEELHRWNQNYLETLEFITHELKNQVAAMKLNLLAVRDGYVGEITTDQREALDDITATMHRTEEMILNYLNLSRIERGELEVRARPIALASDVLDPVLRELSSRFAEQDLRVEVDLPPELVAQADPTLLQVVFSNLLGNATKYGRQGGQIRVSGEAGPGRVEVHIWNDGPGVRPEELDHLFQRFSRLNGADVKERGTGLGLFIAREILLKHEGDLRVESEYPHWIDFILTLPAASY
ncbi:MAG: HAMP domain-containing protein [candidate division WS1 bacterium]|jgi:two-component system NtrC family sensor kinase|nr:HAMP domain-containing protein [candidate division WS1 bacterium]